MCWAAQSRQKASVLGLMDLLDVTVGGKESISFPSSHCLGHPTVPKGPVVNLSPWSCVLTRRGHTVPHRSSPTNVTLDLLKKYFTFKNAVEDHDIDSPWPLQLGAAGAKARHSPE